MTASDYLNQTVNFGGTPTRLGDVIETLRNEGADERRIDHYIMGLLRNVEISAHQRNLSLAWSR